MWFSAHLYTSSYADLNNLIVYMYMYMMSHTSYMCIVKIMDKFQKAYLEIEFHQKHSP